MAPPPPALKDLVLVGGGHSHALLLRMLAMQPMTGVRITLVSDTSHAPYSGMLPGHIAGFYSYDEIHIDLRRLCTFAGVAFVGAQAVGLDLDAKAVLLDGRPPICFDIASLNIGSTPDTSAVEGAVEHAVRSKPVPDLLAGWAEAVATAEALPAGAPPLQITVVGGGAGGVELSLCMRHRLGDRARVRLIHSGSQLLDHHNAKVRALLEPLLVEHGIEVVLTETVTRIDRDAVTCRSGRSFPTQRTFWITSAGAPAWIAGSGLATDASGFMATSATLQSTSHPWVFAAGDVATVSAHPRPKSGVFAVRQAKPLLANLRRALADQPPKPFTPQKQFLSLIGTGSGSAVASRRFLAWKSKGMWALKDRIDRKFMARFKDLPAMDPAAPPQPAPSHPTPPGLAELANRARMRCQGCAAKVSANTLSNALSSLASRYPKAVDLDSPDDAAVFAVPPDHHLVQTTDYLPSIVDDPFTFARIATLHAFSDIFAMGARPHSCLATVLLPFADESLVARSLQQALSGIACELEKMGARLIGGHTAEGAVLGLSLACNGLVSPGTALQKASVRPGDQLVLTKPLGTGSLFAAAMRLDAKGSWIDEALASMLTSNLTAAEIARRHHATACTDVTGFGLAGHLLEMIRPLGLQARVRPADIPVFEGARQTLARGIISTLAPSNARASAPIANLPPGSPPPEVAALFDPQTSGGLLIALPQTHAAACLDELRSSDSPHACLIGEITSREPDAPALSLTL
ncbi:hypothetical protein BH23VER1_BH23VER1_15470 [soil metagenome]